MLMHAAQNAIAVKDVEDVPVPIFVLRGHSAEAQSVCFGTLHDRSIIISGDSEGFAIVWSLEDYRPIAIWKAHKKSIISVSVFSGQILTHGRDNKVYIWSLLEGSQLSSSLPILKDEIKSCTRPSPFMLCALDVNSLNFCRVSICSLHKTMIAAPALIGNDFIDVYTIPQANRVATKIIPPQVASDKTGSVMCVDLQYPFLAVGYENGSIALFELYFNNVDWDAKSQNGEWKCLRQWKHHHDAVLSVVIDMATSVLFSSGIDAKFIRYSMDSDSLKQKGTKHAGQQSMTLRSDGKLLATAGWDGFGRVYSVASMRQLAVLRYHKATIHAVAFQPKEDGNMIALASKDSKISLWKLY